MKSKNQDKATVSKISETKEAIFLNIPLNEILVDPNQPRKTLDDESLQELTQSIMSKGVVQPIVVRRKPEHAGYYIVCGERRYKASLSVNASIINRNTIPAIVRELTDEEALELQIIENLQRKDVHPIEEAAAFKKLYETMHIEAIADRVGKSPKYVARRLKLTDLIPEAERIFFTNHMSLSTAFELAKLDPVVQREIINEEAPEDWENSTEDWKIDNVGWYVKNKCSSLKEAIFNISDPDLYPEAGSCENCPFNSKNKPLLFDEESDHVCSKPSCFAIKTERHNKKLFEHLVAQPDIICIAPGYYFSSVEKEEIKAAEEVGIKILDRKYYDRRWPETPPYNYEDWFNEEYSHIDAEDLPTEEELKEEYEAYRKEQQEDYERYLGKLSSGKIVEAYVVCGKDKGKKVAIELKENAKKAAAAKSSESSQIVEEIESIQVREKRSEELDAEKVFDKVKKLYGSNIDSIVQPTSTLSSLQQLGILVAMQKAGDYEYCRWFSAKYNVDRYNPSAESIYKLNLSPSEFNECLLRFMAPKLINSATNHLSQANAKVIFDLVCSIDQLAVTEILLEQQGITDQRKERIQKRIEALKRKLADHEDGK